MLYLVHHNLSSQIKTSVGGNIEFLILCPLCSWVQWAWTGMVEERQWHPQYGSYGQPEWKCLEEGAINDNLYGKQIIFHSGPISRDPFTYLLPIAPCHQTYNFLSMSLPIWPKKFFSVHAPPETCISDNLSSCKAFHFDLPNIDKICSPLVKQIK